MKTPNLIDILAQKTEQKGETRIDEGDFEPPKTEVPNPDDFDEPEPKPEEPPKPDFKEFTQEPPPVKPEKPRLSESEYAQSAEMVIALYDGIQTLSLPWLYQKSMFKKDELKTLKELKTRQKTDGNGETQYNQDELKLLNKYSVYEELKENVPYTDKEVELIKDPLAKVFSKYNVQLGPEFLLMSALAYVSMPRFLPLLTKFE